MLGTRSFHLFPFASRALLLAGVAGLASLAGCGGAADFAPDFSRAVYAAPPPEAGGARPAQVEVLVLDFADDGDNPTPIAGQEAELANQLARTLEAMGCARAERVAAPPAQLEPHQVLVRPRVIANEQYASFGSLEGAFHVRAEIEALAQDHASPGRTVRWPAAARAEDEDLDVPMQLGNEVQAALNELAVVVFRAALDAQGLLPTAGAPVSSPPSAQPAGPAPVKPPSTLVDKPVKKDG